MSATLYELTTAYSDLLLHADELSPEAVADTLEAIQEEINIKAENIVKLMRNLDGDIEAIKAEEKRLADKRRAIENRKEALKAYLEQQLAIANIDKVKTPLFTIGMQNNPPKVEVLDESVLPDEWFVIKRDVDKKRISEFLKEGFEIPGVSLIQTRSLRIR